MEDKIGDQQTRTGNTAYHLEYKEEIRKGLKKLPKSVPTDESICDCTITKHKGLYGNSIYQNAKLPDHTTLCTNDTFRIHIKATYNIGEKTFFTLHYNYTEMGLS